MDVLEFTVTREISNQGIVSRGWGDIKADKETKWEPKDRLRGGNRESHIEAPG